MSFSEIDIARQEVKRAQLELYNEIRDRRGQPDSFETTKNLCEKFLDAFYVWESLAHGANRREKSEGVGGAEKNLS